METMEIYESIAKSKEIIAKSKKMTRREDFKIEDAKALFEAEAQATLEKKRLLKYKYKCCDCGNGCTGDRCLECSVKRRVELNDAKRSAGTFTNVRTGNEPDYPKGECVGCGAVVAKQSLRCRRCQGKHRTHLNNLRKLNEAGL